MKIEIRENPAELGTPRKHVHQPPKISKKLPLWEFFIPSHHKHVEHHLGRVCFRI